MLDNIDKMEERCRKSGHDDNTGTRPDQKMNWFKSLTRRKKGRDDKENVNNLNRSASSNDVTSTTPEEAGPSSSSDSPTKNTNMFFTLRKHIQKRFQNTRQCRSTQIAGDHDAYAPMSADGGAAYVPSAIHSNAVEQPALSNDAEPTVNDSDRVANNLEMEKERAMTEAKNQMSIFGWYWGPLTRNGAQKRLQGKQNGSFLVRDSQTNGYHFTISFKSASCTLHYRIEFVNGYWYIESGQYISMVDLIEDTIQKSKDNVLCYVKQSSQLQPPFPVRLINPISRFCEVPSLQHLCRFVIRNNISVEHVDYLPLPTVLQDYVRKNFYENHYENG